MQAAGHSGTAGGSASRWRPTPFKPVGIFVPKLVRETCQSRGFVNIDIVLRWPEIVGQALARHTWPMRIEWPRRQETVLRPDGTEAPNAHRTRLVVGSAPAKALDVEYAKQAIMERVNGYLGYRAVTELAASPDYAMPPADPAPAARHFPSAPAAAGGPLSAALARLGQAIARHQ